MDFDDISRVVPWIETSPALGLDLNAEQRANPRAFKSHLEYEQLPKEQSTLTRTRSERRFLFDVQVYGRLVLSPVQSAWRSLPNNVTSNRWLLASPAFLVDAVRHEP